MSQSVSLLLRLILNECSVLYPEVLSSAASKLNCIRYGLVPERLKHDLLSKVYAKFRGSAVLKLGLAIRQSGYSPILNILFESTDPSSVLKKWCSVEENCDIRLRIDYKEINSGKGFLVNHIALSGPRPTNAEDLFICGTQISIFEAVGCQNVRCYLVEKGQEDSLLYANGEILDHLFSHTDFSSQWRIEWDSFIKNETKYSNLSPLADYDDPAEIIASVISILSGDISRNWKIGEVSAKIGMSRRSLQRYLSCLETSFSLLKIAVRIHCASRLLSSSTLSITEIGYECGFSDTPHFSRSFHQSSGLPPSNYRKISQGVELSPIQ